jgi:hypothetical protein
MITVWLRAPSENGHTPSECWSGVRGSYVSSRTARVARVLVLPIREKGVQWLERIDQDDKFVWVISERMIGEIHVKEYSCEFPHEFLHDFSLNIRSLSIRQCIFLSFLFRFLDLSTIFPLKSEITVEFERNVAANVWFGSVRDRHWADRHRTDQSPNCDQMLNTTSLALFTRVRTCVHLLCSAIWRTLDPNVSGRQPLAKVHENCSDLISRDPKL